MPCVEVWLCGSRSFDVSILGFSDELPVLIGVELHCSLPNLVCSA